MTTRHNFITQLSVFFPAPTASRGRLLLLIVALLAGLHAIDTAIQIFEKHPDNWIGMFLPLGFWLLLSWGLMSANAAALWLMRLLAVLCFIMLGIFAVLFYYKWNGTLAENSITGTQQLRAFAALFQMAITVWTFFFSKSFRLYVTTRQGSRIPRRSAIIPEPPHPN